METKDIREVIEVPEGYEIELVDENNVLNIIGIFNENMLQMVYNFISDLDEDNYDPIIVNISSRGGELESLFGIIDLLKSTGRELHGNVNGYAYSSALGLFCACDKRSMGDMGSIMYHQCSYGLESHVQGHRDYLEETLTMQEKYDEIIINASDFTKEELESHKYRDLYMDKTTAIKRGIVNVL